ncbi:glycosyltransferase [Arthrobacter oryzae]|uniref:glycosyltransferase n=1 Tax=Arthrobacter oryzae TaxID=409290 RepID=UPI00273C1D62|nr:glycosyltransferase [Arthrobacter oryzae]WLQ07124.1 glycosyltransferase [Arthrobacter oryzae]
MTYDDRFDRLTKATVARALEAGAKHVVVVDNGSSHRTQDLIRTSYDEERKVTVVLMDENTGSAAGFSVGIQAALARTPAYIWLLDDDNWVEPDALTSLLAARDSAAYLFDDELTSVCGFRDLDNAHQRLAQGVPVALAYPPAGSFMFFDLLTFLRRQLHKRGESSLELTCIPEAPYGGFLFPAGLVQEIGLPPEELFLYADDTVWTSRSVRRGHRIVLDRKTKIHDADGKWARESGAGPIGLLDSTHMTKLYFSARNRVIFERSRITSGKNEFRYWLNKKIYFGAAQVASRLRNCRDSFETFRHAVRDGEAGRLDSPRRLRIET